MSTDDPGLIIPPVRPHWTVYLTAVLVVGLGTPAIGLGLAVVASLLVIVSAGMWRCVALLGYAAAVLTPDDEDQGDG
jgi:hypothetical protein